MELKGESYGAQSQPRRAAISLEFVVFLCKKQYLHQMRAAPYLRFLLAGKFDLYKNNQVYFWSQI
jgi:hypothetical protein